MLFALLTVPTGIASASGSPCSRTSGCGASAIYRTIFSSTVATSVAVASVIFGTLLNPPGRPAAVARASRPTRRSSRTRDWALLAVAVVTVWQTSGSRSS